jgi:hypothetical protein
MPQIRSEADLSVGRAFPLDAYVLDGAQLHLIQQAARLLQVECVAEKGFVLTPLASLPEVIAVNRLVAQFGLGVLAEAREYGYDVPPKYWDVEKPPVGQVSPPSSEAFRR